MRCLAPSCSCCSFAPSLAALIHLALVLRTCLEQGPGRSPLPFRATTSTLLPSPNFYLRLLSSALCNICSPLLPTSTPFWISSLHALVSRCHLPLAYPIATALSSTVDLDHILRLRSSVFRLSSAFFVDLIFHHDRSLWPHFELSLTIISACNCAPTHPHVCNSLCQCCWLLSHTPSLIYARPSYLDRRQLLQTVQLFHLPFLLPRPLHCRCLHSTLVRLRSSDQQVPVPRLRRSLQRSATEYRPVLFLDTPICLSMHASEFWV